MVRSHARRSGISSVDDLESESVSTGHTSLREKRLYVYAESGDYVTNVDPAATTTPLQDALDHASNKGGGAVSIPGAVNEESPIDHPDNVNLYNRGGNFAEINFTDSAVSEAGASGYLYDIGNVNHVEICPIYIHGPGYSAGAVKSALGASGPFNRSVIGGLRVGDVLGKAIYAKSSDGGSIWSTTIPWVMVDNVDPQGDFCVDLRGGVNVTIGQMNLAPRGVSSGQKPGGLYKADGSIAISYYGWNGENGRGVLNATYNCDTDIGIVNFEPEYTPDVTSTAVVKIDAPDGPNPPPAHIGGLRTRKGSAGEGIQVASPGNVNIGPISDNTSALNTLVSLYNASPTSLIEYSGTTGDVYNQAGSTAGKVLCKEDLAFADT